MLLFFACGRSGFASCSDTRHDRAGHGGAAELSVSRLCPSAGAVCKVRALVLPRFDTQEMAKRTLGVHWSTRTAEEQAEFTQLFTDLVEKSYRQTLDRYTQDVKVTYDQERIESPFAEVDTHLTSPAQHEPIAITYRLHTVGDQWLIYDMVIANVSLVRNYRAQFERILGKSGYRELIETIKRKLHDLDEPLRSTENS